MSAADGQFQRHDLIPHLLILFGFFLQRRALNKQNERLVQSKRDLQTHLRLQLHTLLAQLCLQTALLVLQTPQTLQNFVQLAVAFALALVRLVQLLLHGRHLCFVVVLK
jgi:hypothetical protein